jgi:hypothetical protein
MSESSGDVKFLKCRSLWVWTLRRIKKFPLSFPLSMSSSPPPFRISNTDETIEMATPPSSLSFSPLKKYEEEEDKEDEEDREGREEDKEDGEGGRGRGKEADEEDEEADEAEEDKEGQDGGGREDRRK